jgi:hypothetical protein
LAARARPCAARTRLLGLIATPNGALRPPPSPPIAALLFLILPPKNILNLSNLGRPRQGPFSFHRNTEAMKNEVHLPPASPIAALLILPAIFWGQNYVPVPPHALIFFWFFFSIVFGSFLFIILFPFYSPFQFLLILLFLSLLILLFLSFLILPVGAILRLLFLLLLYFKLFVDLQTCILMIYVHLSVILRGFSKGPSLFYLLILLYCTLFFLFLFFSSYI